VSTSQVTTGPSRRRIPRIPVSDGVWVYWESPPYRDISRILDLSPAGMFMETRARKHEGDCISLHFLVQEGPIRAEAVVRHMNTGHGLGMKISSISSQDVPQLTRLLSRLREGAIRQQSQVLARP
jgi:PilZ domain-containing protein